MTLCEFAAIRDGMGTLYRSGIDRIGGPETPVEIFLYLFVELEPDDLPAGDHEFEIRKQTPEGVVTPLGKGKLKLEKAGPARFVVPIALTEKAFGPMDLVLAIGGLTGKRSLMVERVVAQGEAQ